MMNKGFMIAATASGVGKTTIARGLMALLTRKGYKVQPYKCGPDYIDTKFHHRVCGRPSINLDTFMASKEHVRHLFGRYGQDADIRIVEGMMGVFDGYDRLRGSSAEIARVLGLSVVLVVDAEHSAYSTAALLEGFKTFDAGIWIAGVIFNKVGSERHRKMLLEACEDINMQCFGFVPKDAALEQSSRYLGLDFSEPADNERLLQLLEENVDWQRLLEIETDSEPVENSRWERLPQRMVCARNEESFSFIYQETIDRYERVEYFDPEREEPRLESGDLLYLPGGYPEKHLAALTANEACRRAVRDFVEGGGEVVAECGGMMYLCNSVVDDEGEYAMCGVLPYTVSARRADRHLSLGYRRFELDGMEYRGHEFHYTQFAGEQPESAAQVYDAKGNPVPSPIIKYKNVVASYIHFEK